jgi:hypothetical protein
MKRVFNCGRNKAKAPVHPKRIGKFKMKNTIFQTLAAVMLAGAPAQADQIADAIAAIEETPVAACLVQEELRIYAVKQHENGTLTGLGELSGMTVLSLGENIVASSGSVVQILGNSTVTIIDDGASLSGPCARVNATFAELLASDEFSKSTETTITGKLAVLTEGLDEREAEVARREAAVDKIIADKIKALDARAQQLKALADRQSEAFAERTAALDAREAALTAQEATQPN